MLCPLLVDDPCGNLLSQRLGLALVEQAFLDVHVLALTLGAPGVLRHDGSFAVSGGCSATPWAALQRARTSGHLQCSERMPECSGAVMSCGPPGHAMAMDSPRFGSW